MNGLVQTKKTVETFGDQLCSSGFNEDELCVVFLSGLGEKRKDWEGINKGKVTFQKDLSTGF